ncbi:uncharacterized protein PGTG_18650 [Puccinia graminis f. sp. tritici CRL 75-36-700-3]|uniref:Uncharacterized protein n=1 Tax=Puccinia graminis f. sp. tritici (strain CRL 75-36-700-3 / race SCCL) TaxID=418459 RepID=E3L891_PUCGT|nr:uncharacterized protein PGTG_18650 [Puccinia graminis f. sp. tritici CRL 75-36-700-3]EFP92766.2 hypothetical protein PGTG_18650 [Puccinia graminis f. sp. tritici CRL 75-36-700-3]
MLVTSNGSFQVLITAGTTSFQQFQEDILAKCNKRFEDSGGLIRNSMATHSPVFESGQDTNLATLEIVMQNPTTAVKKATKAMYVKSHLLTQEAAQKAGHPNKQVKAATIQLASSTPSMSR